jgi:DNA-binding CsgD family transcriptional regulator
MTDHSRASNGTAATGGIAQLVLDRMGYGLIACDRRMVVMSCTEQASRLLEGVGRLVIGRALPSRLENGAREAIRCESPVRIEAGRGGRAAYLSAVAVDDPGPVAFVAWVRQEVIRESDVEKAMQARYMLTTRDVRLLFHLRGGHTNRRIAAETGWTVGTVRVYVHDLYVKLSVHTRGEAVALVNTLLHVG